MKRKFSCKGNSLKRKLKGGSSTPRKKIKVSNIDELPWKSISAGQSDDGMLGIEEVEGVEIVYEDTVRGKLVKFNVLEKPQVVAANDTEPVSEIDNEEGVESNDEEDEEDSVSSQEEENEEEVSVDFESSLPDWQSYGLNHCLGKALKGKEFNSPTPIQAAALPVALKGKDIVGIAQTGSGKTLAYGLPILNYLLNHKKPTVKMRRPVRTLIIAPTRELALQVSSHLDDLLKAGVSSHHDKTLGQKKPPPHVSVATIVGGMSAQKQRRILDRGVDIIVATPGRLWDIIQEDDQLSQDLHSLKFLVLDEADRMIEAGHYAELESIIRLTLRNPSEEEAEENDVDEPTESKHELQTLVFSATLSKDLQRNLKKPMRHRFSKKKGEEPASTLDDLLLRLDFRDPEPEIIDLTPEGNLISTLKEGRINCLTADKDHFLYYFFLRYPGRSLVFLSSIDGIRRLLPLMELLNIQAFPLHSQLEQRQRLKNLDKFKSVPNAVLLATDIAARGLDIPAVDHVIHFNIPRTADTYIHRNGRTARANRKGFSMLMCAPDERRVVKALMNSLKREENEIQEMDIELSMLDKVKDRVQLARQIETSQHKLKKTNHDRHWMKETAEALGVYLDSDFASDDEDNHANSVKRARANKINALKHNLKRMLSTPLIGRGVSAKFITSGTRPIVDDLLAGELNDNMVGIRKAEAGSEMVKSRKDRPAVKSMANPNVEEAGAEIEGDVVKGNPKARREAPPQKQGIDDGEADNEKSKAGGKKATKNRQTCKTKATTSDTAGASAAEPTPDTLVTPSKSDAGKERIRLARLKGEAKRQVAQAS